MSSYRFLLFSGVIALKPYVYRQNPPTKGISLGCWLAPKRVPSSSEIMVFEPYAGHKHPTQKLLFGPAKLPGVVLSINSKFLCFNHSVIVHAFAEIADRRKDKQATCTHDHSIMDIPRYSVAW